MTVKLSTLVVNRVNPKPKHGVKTLSDITVRFGSVTVARATVAGPHNEVSALREFSIRPKAFTAVDENIFASLTGGK